MSGLRSGVAAALVLLACAPAAAGAVRHAGAPRASLSVPLRAVQPQLARRAAATEAAACTVAMTPLAFGAAPARGETISITVTVVCPSALRYRLQLDQPGGCAATRAMQSAYGALAYRVLTPQGDVWCDGSAGTAVVAGVGTGGTQTFTATATIVDDADRKHAGTFADTLTGTIEVDRP